MFCAKSFGCAILVLPEDADSPPYVFGEGPVGFAVNYWDPNWDPRNSWSRCTLKTVTDCFLIAMRPGFC